MKKFQFRVWHRRIGMISFLMVIWLAFSGVLINHSDQFGLNEKYFSSQLMNKWYGIQAQKPEAFRFGENFIYCSENNLYVNESIIAECGSQLSQAMFYQGSVVLLAKQAIYILSEDGELLDIFPFSLMNKFPQSMAVNDGRLIVEGFAQDQRLQQWFVNLESLELEEVSGLDMNDKGEALATHDLPEHLIASLPTQGVKIERILLDAHSGRLFGKFGVLIVDAFALVFVFLSLSGFYLFLKQKR